MPDSFFDTNVLLYLLSGDITKSMRAERLVAGGGVMSVQVLNEFANVSRRKMRLEWSEIHTTLNVLRDLLDVRAITVDVHVAGLALAERHRLSIYDAMIVASALDADCKVLWSEDMHHGLVVEDRLKVIDPFRTAH